MKRRYTVAGRKRIYVLTNHYDNFNGNHFHSGEIAKRDKDVLALAISRGHLYDGGEYGAVYETRRDAIVAERENHVLSLADHDNELFDAGEYGVYETFHKKRLTDRPASVIVSHKGRLLGADNFDLYDILTGENIVTMEQPIVDAESHYNGRFYLAVDKGDDCYNVYEICKNSALPVLQSSHSDKWIHNIPGLIRLVPLGDDALGAVEYRERYSKGRNNFLWSVCFGKNNNASDGVAELVPVRQINDIIVSYEDD